MTSVNPAVKLLDNGDYLTELTTQLKAAESSKVDVDVIQYNFFIDSGDKANSPDPGGAVAGVENLLKGIAPKTGAKVRVLLEGDHSADIKTRNTLTLNDLKAAGISAVFDTTKRVTHTKMFRFGNTIMAGSHNMTNTSVTKNNEVSLEVTSKKLATAAKTYMDSLLKDGTKLYSKATVDGNVTLLTDDAAEKPTLDLINHTKTGELYASMYDFRQYIDPATKQLDAKGSAILSALTAAAKRGVKLHLYLEQSDDFASEGSITAGNEAIQSYLVANAPAAKLDLQLDSPKQISHQKFITNGSTSLIGSTNWTSDDYARHQMNWLVKDTGIAEQLQAILKNEMATDSAPAVTVP